MQNLDSAVDFCPQCNNIIDLNDISDIIECNRCGYKVYYEPRYIVTTLQMEPKAWLSTIKEEDYQSTKATIESQCTKCGHNLAYFWTVQIRSVDEGSTVFYECVSCGDRYQKNN
ncbi:hypothetical protein pb186bvf_010738 [Paramecium bursaria]